MTMFTHTRRDRWTEDSPPATIGRIPIRHDHAPNVPRSAVEGGPVERRPGRFSIVLRALLGAAALAAALFG